MVDFRRFLISQNKTKVTIKQIVNYAKKYGHVLDTGDASVLMSLSPRNKHHALTALANLAKYTGRYDKFQLMRQRYNLKWSKGDSLLVFQRFFSQELTLDVMLDKVREMIHVLPSPMAEVVRYACLVGLRPAEVVESVRLIAGNKSQHYYDSEQQTLRHYLFPDIFLRSTKKAYISYLSADNYRRIANLGGKTPSWTAIRLACNRRGIGMSMRYCRKIFASYLSQQGGGIQSEVIDFLQGRVSTSVFSRHYLTPSGEMKSQVLAAVDKLAAML
jgi:hypothetical protein